MVYWLSLSLLSDGIQASGLRKPGHAPVSTSATMTPEEKMSLAEQQPPEKTSGAQKPTLPMTSFIGSSDEYTTVPKSMSFNVSSRVLSNMKFSGLMSLWRRPAQWMYSTAPRIWEITLAACRSGSGALFSTSNSSGPRQRSMTRYMVASSSAIARTRTTFSCRNSSTERTSSGPNLPMKPGWDALLRTILTATIAPVPRSRAAHTCPLVPFPSTFPT
mmetsp:Transcript_12897/g.40523  ORF Transcript_12897/g.40523 Transcript_12897/m.40523 type:complete len:217 (-) Transcript_12897:158-808(-)